MNVCVQRVNEARYINLQTLRSLLLDNHGRGIDDVASELASYPVRIAFAETVHDSAMVFEALNRSSGSWYGSDSGSEHEVTLFGKQSQGPVVLGASEQCGVEVAVCSESAAGVIIQCALLKMIINCFKFMQRRRSPQFGRPP